MFGPGPSTSPDCDPVLQHLLATHARARAFFTEAVASAVAQAAAEHASHGDQPPARSLDLGGPCGWSLTVKSLAAAPTAGSMALLPLLLVEHSFLDMPALLARSNVQRLLCSKYGGREMASVVLLTMEGQVLHRQSGSAAVQDQGEGCSSSSQGGGRWTACVDQVLGAGGGGERGVAPNWLKAIFALAPHLLEEMAGELQGGKEWR